MGGGVAEITSEGFLPLLQPACSPSSREVRAEIQDRGLEVRADAEAEEEDGLLACSL